MPGAGLVLLAIINAVAKLNIAGIRELIAYFEGSAHHGGIARLQCVVTLHAQVVHLSVLVNDGEVGDAVREPLA